MIERAPYVRQVRQLLPDAECGHKSAAHVLRSIESGASMGSGLVSSSRRRDLVPSSPPSLLDRHVDQAGRVVANGYSGESNGSERESRWRPAVGMRGLRES